MDVLAVIDQLDDLVHGAKPVPLSGRLRVDRRELDEIVERLRSTIPVEITEARAIVHERRRILTDAERAAERILSEAPERERQLAAEHHLVRHAERVAQEIIEAARARERELRRGAEDYADALLRTLELNLTRLTAAVDRGRQRLRRPE
jgi:cell division septum initiation protein DivIVA